MKTTITCNVQSQGHRKLKRLNSTALSTSARNGRNIECCCQQLSKEMIPLLMLLMETCMKVVYNEYNWSWDLVKRNEMTENAAWYLISYHNPQKRNASAYDLTKINETFSEKTDNILRIMS